MKKKDNTASDIDALLSRKPLIEADEVLKERVLHQASKAWGEEDEASLSLAAWLHLAACVMLSSSLIMMTNQVFSSEGYNKISKADLIRLQIHYPQTFAEHKKKTNILDRFQNDDFFEK